MNTMLLFQILSVSILLVASIIAIAQLNFGVKTAKADNARKKKQATIEYLSKIRTEYKKCNRELMQKYGANPTDIEKTKILMNDKDYRIRSSELLGMFEHLAVGVNAEIFDIVILNRMSGRYLIAVFDQWKVYIDERRKRPNRQYAYCEFEILVGELKLMRIEQNNNKHSTVSKQR